MANRMTTDRVIAIKVRDIIRCEMVPGAFLVDLEPYKCANCGGSLGLKTSSDGPAFCSETCAMDFVMNRPCKAPDIDNDHPSTKHEAKPLAEFIDSAEDCDASLGLKTKSEYLSFCRASEAALLKANVAPLFRQRDPKQTTDGDPQPPRGGFF